MFWAVIHNIANCDYIVITTAYKFARVGLIVALYNGMKTKTINNERGFKMNKILCQACDGEILPVIGLSGSNDMDQKGVCADCGAVYLREISDHGLNPIRKFLALRWCKCEDTDGQEVFYFTDSGAHGWYHTACAR